MFAVTTSFVSGRLALSVINQTFMQRAKKPCSQCGCPALDDGDKRYCEKHERAEPRKQHRVYDAQRGSSHQRGYGARWRKLRLCIIARDPFCMIGEICDPIDPVKKTRSGRRAPSTDVDHIVPREAGGSDHEENLQGACHECHSWKTATQDSKFAKKKAE